MKKYLGLIFLYLTSITYAAKSPYIFIQDNKTGEIWRTQVADTEESRRQGLMYRAYLFPWEGMIFIFPKMQLVNFWMKNTFLPLNIRFYNQFGQIIHHYPYVPPCYTSTCPLYSSKSPVKYVLELRPTHILPFRIAGNIQMINFPCQNCLK